MGLKSKAKDNVTIEAGADLPGVESFLAKPNYAGKIITDMSAINTSKIGDVKIELEIDGKKFTSLLSIEDTMPPKGNPVEQHIFKGNEIKPEDFVNDIEDATQVTCSFAAEPDVLKPGWQEITVSLTDEGGNLAEINTRLYVFDVIEELVIEAGATQIVAAKDFVRNYIEAQGLSVDIEADIPD
ncbi:MAG: hypothetical protein FWH48_11280, partial [Oscillospiraceae bacterium]|nr:hypothetical protein [Oscillospiraceae bacterium]